MKPIIKLILLIFFSIFVRMSYGQNIEKYLGSYRVTDSTHVFNASIDGESYTKEYIIDLIWDSENTIRIPYFPPILNTVKAIIQTDSLLIYPQTFTIESAPNMNIKGKGVFKGDSLYYEFDAYGGISEGSIYSKCIGIRMTSSIEQPKVGHFNIKVSPNPAQDAITFELGEHKVQMIELFNAQSSPVDKLTVPYTQKRIVYVVDHLPPGVYFYKAVRNDGQIASGKFIVL